MSKSKGTDGDEVVRHLGQLGRDLQNELDTLSDLEGVAVDAEGAYKVKFSQVFRNSQGSVEDRKQEAVAATDDLWRTWSKAVSAVRLQRESLKALHARIDIGRTMASREKAIAALAGRDDAA